MRVLVVGGAGYVGSHLVPLLLEKGWAVRVLDRLYFGVDGIAPWLGECELVRADMRQVPNEALDNVDAVVNLGGLSNDPSANYNPTANMEMNYHAVVQLARRCKARGIPRYVFAGSCSLYDRKDANEQTDRLLTEEASIEPVGHYAQAKFLAEQDLLELAGDGFVPTVLRKGTVYGYSRRMRFDLVVNTMVRDALAQRRITLHGGGETWRPLVSVIDAARAYVSVLEAPEQRVCGQIYNVVHRNLRISEVGLRVQAALRHLGVECEIRADFSRPAARNYRVSGKKIEEALGFVADISIEDAVEEMVGRLSGWTPSQLSQAIFYNIGWMETLEKARVVLGSDRSVFDVEDQEDMVHASSNEVAAR